MYRGSPSSSEEGPARRKRIFGVQSFVDYNESGSISISENYATREANDLILNVKEKENETKKKAISPLMISSIDKTGALDLPSSHKYKVKHWYTGWIAMAVCAALLIGTVVAVVVALGSSSSNESGSEVPLLTSGLIVTMTGVSRPSKAFVEGVISEAVGVSLSNVEASEIGENELLNNQKDFLFRVNVKYEEGSQPPYSFLKALAVSNPSFLTDRGLKRVVQVSNLNDVILVCPDGFVEENDQCVENTRTDAPVTDAPTTNGPAVGEPETTVAPTEEPSPPTTTLPTTVAPTVAPTEQPVTPTTISPVPETTVVPIPETTAAPIPETTVVPVPETTAAPIPETTAPPIPETTAAPIPETTAAPPSETTVAPPSETTAAPAPETTAAQETTVPAEEP